MSAIDAVRDIVNSRISSGAPGSITAEKLRSTLVALINAIEADRTAAEITVTPDSPLSGEDLQSVLDEVAALLAAAAPLDSPALTGVPTAPTAAWEVSSMQIATTAFVQNAIAALVDSAPGALNQLSELAAALGNDANFSTTVLNALAEKAPLDSPELTGVPTAPTATPGTDTEQLATTAFVQAAVTASSTLPEGHLFGMTLANNGTDATNDIDIASGSCRSDDNTTDIVLGSGITKQIDAAWAVGTAAGGLDTGSVADGTYHVWAIKRPDTGVVDVLFSTSATSPTMPANYTKKRRIGAIVRASGAIRGFRQVGDHFLYPAALEDVDVATLTTSRSLYTLSVPSGINVKALLRGWTLRASAIHIIIIQSPEETDLAPDSATSPGLTAMASGAGLNTHFGVEVFTNTSAQVAGRATQTGCSLRLFTRGWIDTRGRLA